MFKEVIISLVIICGIFCLNGVTESYTKDSIDTMSTHFSILREELLKEERPKSEELINQVDKIINNWDQYNERLSYFIEHDELEKVDTYLVALKANVETEKYEQAIENLDVCVFILDHIDDKESFLIKNIF